MLILMNPRATDLEVQRVVRTIKDLGFRSHVIPGATRTVVGVTGNRGEVDAGMFERLPGVADVIRVTKPYKLVTVEAQPERTVIRSGDAGIGNGELALIAGPCAIETAEQAFEVAEVVARSGARFFRGGAFKPRSSPYSFQGLGRKGLEILADIRDRFGLRIVTEAMDEAGVDLVERYADVIQVGARNMQNYSLLKRVGRSHLPVLLKRGLAATLEEWLLAAEYVLMEGNRQVVLCERGIRTFSQHAPATLDIAAVTEAQRISHLPVIADPSHSGGRDDLVVALARAAVAAGADGLIVEVHGCPERALCDGSQALTTNQFADLVSELNAIRAIVTPGAFVNDG